MMNPEPTSEHRWLHQLLGDWTCESTADMGTGEPPMQGTGTEHVRALGGLWVLGEGTGTMPGSDTGYMLMTLGYDDAQKVFVGSWVGSMMTNMWVYRGTLDAAQKVLTLETEGPNCTGDGSTARYRDTITLLGPDARTLTSSSLQPDGSWKQFMQATYRRKTA